MHLWCNIWDGLWRWIQRSLCKKRRGSGNSLPGNVYRYQLLANSVDEATTKLPSPTSISDDETLIIDPDIMDVVVDLPPKNQWTEHLVEYPVIAFIGAANVNRLLNSTVMWRSFNDKEIFLFWTFVSCQFLYIVVLYVLSVMYLYVFAKCLASPFSQLLKIHTFIGLSVITMQLLGIPKNWILEKWRFLGPILLEKVRVRTG